MSMTLCNATAGPDPDSPPPLTPVDGDGEEDLKDGPRTTRSGKAFGVMQSRRRHLRQEAIDDPDMEVDEGDDVEDDDDEDEDEAFESG